MAIYVWPMSLQQFLTARANEADQPGAASHMVKGWSAAFSAFLVRTPNRRTSFQTGHPISPDDSDEQSDRPLSLALVDCKGKVNIPAFLRGLNAFNIPYRVLHDEDPGNPTA
ncbi:hypothetical protein PEC18_31200 [Paucibacter sp. O1-1]|nr:hypothetical protein [Paucibacter sp. O1-1]MDA3830172.1 hypothetical protein [Paucibacter sp. O1-1]